MTNKLWLLCKKEYCIELCYIVFSLFDLMFIETQSNTDMQYNNNAINVTVINLSTCDIFTDVV